LHASENLLSRLSKLDSCTVSDAMDAFKLHGTASGLTQLSVSQKIVGKVVTVKLLEVGSRNATVVVKSHLGARAIDISNEDNVIVVANQGRIQMGAWGGLLSRAAYGKGVRGVIVDGAVRDIDECKVIGFPVYGLTGVSKTARGRVMEKSTNTEIRIRGVLVRPTDYVISDGSGVVFIPSNKVESVINMAEKFEKKERLILNQILQGSSVADAIGRNYENMLKDGIE